jgi:hypothetical protein
MRQHSVSALARFIGLVYRYHVPSGLVFFVRVVDARTVYGRIQLQVQPAWQASDPSGLSSGVGSAWVDLATLGALTPDALSPAQTINAQAFGSIVTRCEPDPRD